MPKCLFFLNFLTIKVTKYTVLKVISAIYNNIYDRDKELKGNLRKAPKLSHQALYPGNNKQNVSLALSLFHDTTIAAAKSYYLNREDAFRFLTL